MAFRSYDAAQELTYQADGLTEKGGYADAQSLISEANRYCELMKMACDYYELAAEHYSNGETANGDEAIDAGDDYLYDANREKFPSLREFRDTL